MLASYQIIIQVLQLAYTTQACILNLKAYAIMQASTWICTYQMQTIRVHELVPPTCVLLFSKNFDSSQFLNVAPSLSIVHVQISNCHIFVSISPPLSSISIKGVHLLIQRVALGIDGWHLNLTFFYGQHHICWNDTICIALEIPHIGSLTLVPIDGTSPPMS